MMAFAKPRSSRAIGALLGLAFAAGRAPAQSAPRFRYVPELDMVRSDPKGRLRVVQVDPENGLALPAPPKGEKKPKRARGVPPFLSARVVSPGDEELHQQHVRDVTILQPMQLNQKIRDDLGFAAGVDKTRKATVLSRLNYLQRHESLFEVSNVIGLIQNDEVYLGQLEMRWGKDARTLHVLRSQQRAGPLLANGFPGLVTWEMVQTETENRMDSAKMVRIVMVFPVSQEGPARIRVHMVGDLRRQLGGAIETRKVHVISEFKKASGGVSIKLWTSAGENYPYISWEQAIGHKHERAWQRAGTGSSSGVHTWERPYQPLAPRSRGVRPIPMVALLKIPSSWNRGGYGGAPLRSKKVNLKKDRWQLTAKDFMVAGGMWQFDKKGELVVQTPLGGLNAKRVEAWFETQFAVAKSNPEESQNLRDCLDVVLNWAADMPQPDGLGPGKTPSRVSELLSVR